MKFLLALSLLFNLTIHAQNPIYVDAKGVMRWTATKKEADFFGVNYTTPFAYSFRAQKKLGIDLKKAIDADVYHLARLGIDAFRVHVWDVEISDSAGNLLQNEHLDLFDYLLSKLEERKIYILITPIAFWGNGYPDPDEQTPGFSTKYGKRNAVVNEDAIRAQENYLRQFFQHVNPYTKKTYAQDPFVVAMEINNEPQHSGPKAKVTEYVNRLASAVRGTGWTKPVFYNISESPAYADAVVAAKVDGHSFQWYPTGLVAGFEQKGNLLPHVDTYRIPFLDTIPAFRNRARMVYEFDAGDVLQPVMYPAMARSFRTAGFQWATQFAYDPLYLAPYNTEYQTHYLNLVYTPAKAISLLIASRAFHQLPRGKSCGRFPKDTAFGNFRVSYPRQLSEMNSEEEFYYTNDTDTKPQDLKKLKHIAGVGSSTLVRSPIKSAYFLDRLTDGSWRLEVYPVFSRWSDPFARTSLDRLFASTSDEPRNLEIRLPGLPANFRARSMGEGSANLIEARGFTLEVKPGVYVLSAAGVVSGIGSIPGFAIGINEVPAFPKPTYALAPPVIGNDAGPDEIHFLNPRWDHEFNAYIPDWNQGGYRIIWDSVAERHRLRLETTGNLAAMQVYVGNRFGMHDWSKNWYFAVRGSTAADTQRLRMTMITKNGAGYATEIVLTDQVSNYRIPLDALRPSSYLLLPRPYPGFQPLYFDARSTHTMKPEEIERVQFSILPKPGTKASVEIESIQLKN